MQDLRMPGTAKHSCLGSRTIFSVGAFKEMIQAPCEEVTVKYAEEPAFNWKANPSFPQLSKAKDLCFSHLTEEGKDGFFLLVYSSGSEEAQILIIQQQQQKSWF